MSEKRILIKVFTISPCTGCSGAGENDCDNCYDWDTWNSCLTREQAIEKISHALCTQVHGGCETCEQVAGGNENHCNDYRTYAKAALNALLEGHNDKR